MVRRPSIVVFFLLAVAGCAPEPATPVVHIGGAPPGPLPPAPLRVAIPQPSKPEPPVEPAPELPAPLPAPLPVAPPPVATASVAPSATADMARDLRRGTRSPRSIPLLITECQGLEALLSVTPPASPDRPKLLRRLGESYSELAVGARLAGRAGTMITFVQSASIRHYQAFVTAAPGPCPPSNALSGCGDEGLYYLGIESERAGDLAAARSAYFTLVSTHPSSRFVPGAYVAFGEMFLAESAGDPSKLPLAEASYVQVLKYPPPDNALFGYAHLQLGRTRARQQDRTRAAASFKAAITWAGAYAAVPGAAEIAAAARKELGALGFP